MIWDETQCEDCYDDLYVDLEREEEMIDRDMHTDLTFDEEKYLSEEYDRMREDKLIEEFEMEDE